MQGERRESEVKWKEGENGRQGGSNETEDRKEVVKVKKREAQGVNRELRLLTDILSCTARKLYPVNIYSMCDSSSPHCTHFTPSNLGSHIISNLLQHCAD